MMVATTSRREPEINTHRTDNSRIAIHALQTGTVRVRQNQVRGKGSGLRRLASTALGRDWSPWLPIYSWLIEHPEGLMLVDTGDTSRTSEPGYFPSWHPYYRRGAEFQIQPEQEIGPQLEKRGFSPRDVSRVILTHLHTDHAGGLHHFPTSEIVIARTEFERASGLQGRLRGYLPHRMPEWLDPTLIDLREQPLGPFPASLPLTADGAVTIVPTPGHTPHHISVNVETESRQFFLAGDTSYNEQLLLEGIVDGVAPDERAARETQSRIREFARAKPTVYLPSHDPKAAARLVNLEPLPRG